MKSKSVGRETACVLCVDVDVEVVTMNIVTVFIKTVVMMTTEKNYFPDDGCELYFVLGMWNESFCVR